MNRPRLSIVTPSYNQGSFIENAIISVLEQGYPDLEYIVIDGGSTDGTLEIIRRYAKYLAYWRSEPDSGQVAALNAGFRRATGKVFAFLNSDDFLLQGAVEHMADLYQQYPRAAGWVGGAHYVTGDGVILATRTPKKLGRDDLANWVDNWIYQPSCFFSGEIARAVGLLNPDYEYAFPFDFWMRIARLGELIPSAKIIAAATVHPNTKTLRHLTKGFEEVQAILLKSGYKTDAEALQKYIAQARAQTPIGTAAKLLYESQLIKRKDPGRFVRMPGAADVV